MALRLPVVLMLLALLSIGRAHGDDRLRCDGRLVASGDYGFQLRARCGEPYFIESWTEVRVAPPTGPAALARALLVEDWYFDFGPNRFLHRVRLRDDRVVAIEVLDAWGRSAPLAECSGARVQPGISIGELVNLCGQPSERRALPEAVVYGESPVAGQLPTRRERWMYPLRDDRRLVVELARGRVQSLEATPPLR